MPERRLKRPRDPVELAKLIGDIATGKVKDQSHDDGKNVNAVALGRLGGLKGGQARSSKLSPSQRSEAARAAALVRWKNKK